MVEQHPISCYEKSPEVIQLVSAVFKGNTKLRVIEADIFEWKPDQKFDTLYFDIWPTICTDNLKEMSTLHRKFARAKKPGACVDSWQRSALKKQKRSEKKERDRFRFWG